MMGAGRCAVAMAVPTPREAGRRRRQQKVQSQQAGAMKRIEASFTIEELR